MSKNSKSAPKAATASQNASAEERPVLKRRPRMHGELMGTTCFRLPKSWLDKIDERVKDSGKSRSDFIRDAIEQALAE